MHLSVQNVMNIASRPDEQLEGLHYLFGMHRQLMRNYQAHLDTPIPLECIAEARDLLSEQIDKEVESGFVISLLEMYPLTRAEVVRAGSVEGDTQARESVLDAFSNFLLGCPWPTYGDKVNDGDFQALLSKQYELFLKGV